LNIPQRCSHTHRSAAADSHHTPAGNARIPDKASLVGAPPSEMHFHALLRAFGSTAFSFS
jgi:hypothetical protein